MKIRTVLNLAAAAISGAALLSPSARADVVSLAGADQLTADAAAVGVVSNAVAAPVDPVGAGAWSGVISWTPHIPVSAGQLPDGRLLTWAGEQRRSFDNVDTRFTYAAVWDPRTGLFSEINNTTHDMFCGGVATLPDGRIFVNGGDSCNAASSIFDWRSNAWTALPPMNDTRWYNPSVALPDGGVFTVSGTGSGPNNAERWDAATGWRRLPGIWWGGVASDPGYAPAWHPFVILAPNGKLFHFGPTDTMHWVDPTGTGAMNASGQFVPGSQYPKEGAWAMFEEGRILVAGGGANTTFGSDTTTGTSTKAAYTVDLGGATPVIANVASMNFARQFANSAVLPNGEVLVIGGNSGVKFSDTGSILTPELWNPRTNTWRNVANMAVPRNYHSTALLLADGRVWSGGGGLGGGDHQDAQIFTPPALLNADGSLATRPVITAGTSTIGYAQNFSITATPGLAQFAAIRMSSLTHSVNTDLRRLVVPFTEGSAGSYQLTSHGNQNVMTPGYWMLFGVNPQGVYSEAKIILVSTQNTPAIKTPADQLSVVDRPVNFPIDAFVPGGATPVFSAANLPPGLVIDTATGRITGTVTTTGSYRPTVTLVVAGQTLAATFNWTVSVNALRTGTLVREVWNNISGATLAALTSNAAYPASPSASGTVTSFEGPTNVAENYGQRIRGYLYPPVTGQYRFYLASDDNGQLSLSTDASTANARVIASVPNYTDSREWTKYAAQASALITLQAGQRYYVEALMKEIGGGDNLAVGWIMPGGSTVNVITSEYLSVNSAPTIASPGGLAQVLGENVAAALPATDPDGDALTFTAAGLPPGLGIAPNAPIISGTPTQVGTFTVSVTVSDGAATSSTSFTWTVRSALTLPALSGTPLPSGAAVPLAITGTGGVNPRYTWNFGDGTPDSAWAASGSVTHTFPAPGRYLVTVTATDDSGRAVTSSFFQVIYAPLTAAKPTASSALAYVPAASGNARLWVANPDADTVAVLDAVTGVMLAEIAVPAAPRCVALAPDGRVWVTSAEGASVSILNAATLTVAQTIPLGRGARPFGLAFEPGGGSAWIVLEANGQVVSLNPATGAITRRINVGPNPRHLSISADSTRVYVSRFITPPLPGENTATIDTTGRGGEVVILDAATGALVSTAILQHSEAADSQASSHGIPNYLGAPVISPDGLSAWIPSKQDNIKRGQLRNGSGLAHDNTVRAIVSRLVLATGVESTASRVDFDNSGVPSAAAFDPFGGYLFVALEASRDIAIVDVWNANRLGHFAVGRAPQAVALSPDGLTLYVQNFMDRTVSLYDVSVFQRGLVATPTLLATTSTVATEKLGAQVLRGKQFFYDAADPRLALESYISCASCHNDAGHDGRTWDFTGFGEGLRNTPTLKGHGGQGPSHWTGNFDEVQDFEGQIRNFAGGSGLMSDADFFSGTRNTPLGTPKAGVSADLDALAAYMNSLTQAGDTPMRADAVTLPGDARAGRAIFKKQNCASCHGGAPFTNSALGVVANIGTIKPASGQRLGAPLSGLDVPTLRGLWSTAPYLHDGSAPTLGDAIRAHQGVTLTDAEVGALASYLVNIDDAILAAPVPLTVALAAPAPVVTGPFTVTAIFSGPATGLTLAGLTVTNGAASNLQGSGASYTFTVTPLVPGAVGVGIKTNAALDADGDGNLAAAALAVTAIQNNPPTIADDFSAPALDLVKWRVGTIFGALFGPDDPLLGVVQQNGRLEITPRSDFATEEYRGLVSNAAVDLRGGSLSARVTPAAGGSVTWLGLAGPGSDSLIFAETAGTLYLEQIVGGVWDALTVPFDPALHRYWRIRHQLSTDRILFESSADNVTWTNLWSVARVIPIASLQLDLAAGCDHAEANLGTATIDDVRFVADRAPTITTPSAPTLAVGQSASLQVQASDLDSQPLTFTASGLPAGLTINAGTGLISGKIANGAPASNNVTISVSDGLLSASASFVWKVSALPANWAGNDLGAPALGGQVALSNGTYTVVGAGADIGGTSDQFQFVWRQFVGDGEFIARVPTMTNPDSLAKAGVMMRETLQANSRYALMAITPGPNAVFQARSTTAGVAVQKTAARYSAPNNWVRLIREGDTFAGYRSADGVTWTQTGSATIPMSQAINVGLAVTSHRATAVETATFDNVRISASTLPAGWLGSDIGTPGFTELDSYAAGVFTVKGGGGGITGTSDGLKLLSQSLTGDGEIVARVTSQSNTYAWSKAGVMLRDTTAANSAFALMTITQSYAMYFQTRATAGATAASVTSPRGTAPNNWLRLVRAGNLFTASRSADGVTWTKVGSATINMGATVNIGLAVSAQNNAALSTATFDNVQVKP